MNIIETLNSNGSLKYYGEHDYSTYAQITELINNDEKIRNYFSDESTKTPRDVMIDYLWLKNRIELSYVATNLSDENNRNQVSSLITFLKTTFEKIEESTIYKIMTNNYNDLLVLSQSKKCIDIEINEYVSEWILIKSRMKDEKALILAEKVNRSIILGDIDNYADFFKKHPGHLIAYVIMPSLDKKEFLYGAALECLIHISKIPALKSECLPEAQNIAKELLINLKEINEDNYLSLIYDIQLEYNICLAYDLPELVQYNEFKPKLDDIRDMYFKKHGKTFNMPVDFKEAISILKNKNVPTYYKLSQLTHYPPETLNEKFEACISSKKRVPQSIISELVHIIGDTEDPFFDYNYLRYFNTISCMQEQIISYILVDEELAVELFGYIIALLEDMVKKQILSSSDISLEFSAYIDLLINLLLDEKDDDISPCHKASCRGLAFLFCTITEKFLREIAQSSDPNLKLFRISKLTLKELLTNECLNGLFSPNYLKVLTYELIKIDNSNPNALPVNKQIGLDIRNGIAHDADGMFNATTVGIPLKTCNIFITTVLDYYFRNMLKIS